MKNKLVFILSIASLSLEALNRTGFEFSTGPGYRQDRVVSEIYFNAQNAPDPVENSEVYPHLRMFDWMAAFDASVGGFHLQGDGDMGWFSAQPMRKTILLPINGEANPAVSASFLYTASGRATTGDLRFGYQFDLYVKRARSLSFLPFVGWVYDSFSAHRKNGIPPYFQTTENVEAPYVLANASADLLSNLHQRWTGPTIGGVICWRPLRSVWLDASYCYGWFHYHETFSEIDSALLFTAGPVPSATESYSLENGRSSWSGAHGHLAKFKIGLNLTRKVLLNFDLRYFYFFTGICPVESDGGRQQSRSTLNSASAAIEMALRF